MNCPAPTHRVGPRVATLALLAFIGLAPANRTRADTLRLLFLGNSHTYTNNLPQMFAELSDSGGRAVVTDQNTPGGWTLKQHSHDSTSRAKIAMGGWNYVVLQEQSQIPSIPRLRDDSMYPAVRCLDSLIHAAGCSTALYMTWGWKNGGVMAIGPDSSPPFRDYFEMQDSVATAYQRIAAEVSALVLPAGMGWTRARRLDSLVDLWQADNSHATVEGSYLAACVFYAEFFHASPVGIPFTAGLSPEYARFCQECADWTVLGVSEGRYGGQPRSGIVDPMAVRVSPNPGCGPVTIRCCLKRHGTVRLRVFDLEGRRVFESAAGMQTGEPQVFCWDARDDRGRRVSPGVYVVEVSAGDQTGRRRLVLIRE